MASLILGLDPRHFGPWACKDRKESGPSFLDSPRSCSPPARVSPPVISTPDSSTPAADLSEANSPSKLMASSSCSPRVCGLQNLRAKVKIAADVADALARGLPVVALESTIISHGMPYPQNLECAREVETIIKDNGAVPATVAILDGVPCIGLTSEELERLAALGKNVQKTARRDIPHVVASRGNGATTVSATMFYASKVGIPVFVTGGIGGVHRDGERTLDISSDLTELGKTPVAVICAGVKSILDIPRTLEYLETQGVTVAAFGTNEFPAFFTKSSGCKVPCQIENYEDGAKIIDASFQQETGTGILIAVPIPERHSASGNLIETAIQTALKEAIEKNIAGNAATPFLLARVNELTKGASLTANIALVKNNALVGAKIAVELARIRKRHILSAL